MRLIESRAGVMAVTVTMLFATLAAVPQSASAAHTLPPFSQGVYRIPYVDGTDVDVNWDYHTHNGSLNKVDMNGGDGTQVVAAAGGWVEWAVDIHGDDGGNGDGVAWDGSAHVIDPDTGLPFTDADEEGCMDDVDAMENRIQDSQVTGFCSRYNNTVWIRHPNGEWTKYTHFQTGSLQVSVGQWVDAGQPLGLQGNVGFSGGSHLHHELAVPDDPTDAINQFGFLKSGDLFVINTCGIEDNIYVAGETYEAAPCTNQTPSANAGGPYIVNEGSQIQLDGTASNDPDGTDLSYLWVPDAGLDDATLDEPTFDAVDDTVIALTLTVFDQTEAWFDTDATSVTVLNVAPSVTASGVNIDEGGTTTVSGVITDPGTEDTHSVYIGWDDGGPISFVNPAELAAGVDHTYGDNGTYNVVVGVFDDDGGFGFDLVPIVVSNLDPVVELDTSGETSFPGGDYQVVSAGDTILASADGGDAGSDDLIFSWSVFSWSLGAVNTYFNDNFAPDPATSPFGDFPFFRSDGYAAILAEPGVGQIAVTLRDDDGGAHTGASGVIVTGTAETTRGNGWWKHQYSGNSSTQLDEALLDAYRDIVNAVSSVVSEDTAAGTNAEVHSVLSPSGGDKAAKARASLMAAWLHFASGAVAWDAEVSVQGGSTIGFLDLMHSAELIILDTNSTNAELVAIRRDLDRVRHAN